MKPSIALPQTPHALPQLSDRQIRLTLYALTSALEPSGVFLEVDRTGLGEDLAHLHSLSPADRYHYALALLTTHLQGVYP